MQVVVFRIGDEQFAVETSKVQSICDMMNITLVPKAPSHIKGLINLRGIIITILDINLVLNMKSANTEEQNIIILNLEDEAVGITVDSVDEVLEVEDGSVERVVSDKEKVFIKGVINLKDRIITLLDFDKINI
ncbi:MULTISPECIES: chemotaxis protein CheW [Clostridium]|uniref:Chemotaxis protein CheW n=1 Tax=Clostridium senegalense TaxID=1465809 RepID=A0A6M0GYA8_9CLOT|nr:MULTISPECIES: chemotaxis protein CheW [Clostridium]MBU5225403.1 chemotaxis protein CheW [Clostridium senegalense]NEU03480.1 chemotaxis protein CheW [Clostridium senegalense]